MEDIMIDLPISPTLLRVVRVFRIGRILRLIKASNELKFSPSRETIKLLFPHFVGRQRNPKAFIRFSSVVASIVQHRSATCASTVCLRHHWNVTVRSRQAAGRLKRYDKF